MRRRHDSPARILAIDPSPRGFGFAVLENGTHLIDWGVATLFSRADTEFLVRLETLIERMQPTLLVTEDPVGTRFGTRHLRLLERAAGLAMARHVALTRVPRSAVRAAFGQSGTSKHDIAVAISKLFPELVPRLPPRRTLWSSEDERMNIFDAVALSLAATVSSD